MPSLTELIGRARSGDLGDPARHTAVGVGCGLERLAMLRYEIDDIRKIDVASVA